MPRWARFLSCSFTGLLTSLTGFLSAAYWLEGGAGFWQGVVNYMAEPDFWYTVTLFGLLAAVTLIVARVVVHIYGTGDMAAGLVAGGVVGSAYAAFLLALHAPEWGGLSLSMQRQWVAGAFFTAPFAASGGLIAWLWDRLD